MRQLNLLVERYRITTGLLASDSTFGNNGAFIVPYNGDKLSVVVSDQGGWDHVSVSLFDRCPTWDEMQYVRSLWFRDDEWVVQYSPPKSAHINCHSHCLHMWRKQTATPGPWLEIPPSEFVGPSV